MKKILAMLLALVLAIACFTACAAGNADNSVSMEGNGEIGMNTDTTLDSGAPQGNANGENPYLGEDAKIIYYATLYFQTTDFDQAIAALDALVQSNGGYYETSDLSAGSYYSTSPRSGNYVIRIPQANYSAFMQAVGDVAHLTSKSEALEDVGSAYYDTELHIQALTAQHDRLLALMEQAESVADLITLEEALASVEYELQVYQSDLSRYDSLIDYATITVYLNEVATISADPGEGASLGTRISAAFQNGLQSAKDGFVSFLLWLSYNLIGVIIFLAVVAVAVVLILRARRRKRAKTTPAPEEKPEE